MAIHYQEHCKGIPWNRVPEILETGGMSFTDAQRHQQSFEASYAVIFVFDDKELIGFGRIISDGIRQSAIYDIAIEPTYQGQKIGYEIVKRLIATTPECNVILYASPGKEGFYKRLGFREMKTGMALFSNPERMIDGGFIEK